MTKQLFVTQSSTIYILEILGANRIRGTDIGSGMHKLIGLSAIQDACLHDIVPLIPVKLLSFLHLKNDGMREH